MELQNYNDEIADMIRQSQYNMIHHLPQPTMFGGRRPREHPLPAMNFSPSSLSVGTTSLSASSPFSQYYGGSMLYGRPPIYGANPMVRGGFSFNDFVNGAKDVLTPVARELAPIATDVGKDLLKDYLLGKGKPRGRPRKHHTPIVPYGGGHETTYGRGSMSFAEPIHDVRLRTQRRGGYSFNDFIHDASPVVRELAPIALMAAMGRPKKRERKAKALANHLAKGGYSFNDFLHDAGSVASPIVNEIVAPVAKDVGKDLLKSYLTGKGRKPRKGGFGFKDIGKALAPVGNFALHEVAIPVAKDIGKDALKSLITGKGKPRKPSKRGQIVKEVMAKHGLTLPQASKFVKEHSLY